MNSLDAITAPSRADRERAAPRPTANTKDPLRQHARAVTRSSKPVTDRSIENVDNADNEDRKEVHSHKPAFPDILAVLANMTEPSQPTQAGFQFARGNGTSGDEDAENQKSIAGEEVGGLLLAAQRSVAVSTSIARHSVRLESNAEASSHANANSESVSPIDKWPTASDTALAILTTPPAAKGVSHAEVRMATELEMYSGVPTEQANNVDALIFGANAGSNSFVGMPSVLKGDNSSSIEQLIARGDTNGAAIRAALNSLLAQAGTPLGLQLATQSNAIRSLTRESAPINGLNTTPMVGSSDLPTVIDAPQRALEGLNPELRERLQRVISRMQNEYNHDVTVVETVRLQERQDWLFEQGRSRPGNIVTWTQNSAHTRGDAVDVLIDGKWENAAGYARLQRIAREEGLRTLGMKDPGHLELLRSPADAEHKQSDVGAHSFHSDPARIAGVARVAGIAGVAGIASSGQSERLSQNRTAASLQTTLPSSGLADAQLNASHHNDSSNGFSQQNENKRSPLHSGQAGDRHFRISSTEQSGSESSQQTIGINAVSSDTVSGTTHADKVVTTSSNQAERIAELQQLRSEAPSTPLTRMTVNVGQENGTMEKVTIDLRGNTVNTRITVDEATAGQLRMHTAELQDALGRHGLDGDSIKISSLRQSGSETGKIGTPDLESVRLLSTLGAGHGSASENSTRDRHQGRNWNQEQERREQASHAREDQTNREGRRNRSEHFTGKQS